MRPGKTSAILYSAKYADKERSGRRTRFVCTHNQGHYVLKAAAYSHMAMLEENPDRVKSYFQDPKVRYAT